MKCWDIYNVTVQPRNIRYYFEVISLEPRSYFFPFHKFQHNLADLDHVWKLQIIFVYIWNETYGLKSFWWFWFHYLSFDSNVFQDKDVHFTWFIQHDSDMWYSDKIVFIVSGCDVVLLWWCFLKVVRWRWLKNSHLVSVRATFRRWLKPLKCRLIFESVAAKTGL